MAICPRRGRSALNFWRSWICCWNLDQFTTHTGALYFEFFKCTNWLKNTSKKMKALDQYHSNGFKFRLNPTLPFKIHLYVHNLKAPAILINLASTASPISTLRSKNRHNSSLSTQTICNGRQSFQDWTNAGEFMGLYMYFQLVVLNPANHSESHPTPNLFPILFRAKPPSLTSLTSGTANTPPSYSSTNLLTASTISLTCSIVRFAPIPPEYTS